MLDSFQQAKWFWLRKTDMLDDKTEKVHTGYHTTRLFPPEKTWLLLYFY